MQTFLMRHVPVAASAILAACCLVSCTGTAEVAGSMTVAEVNAFLDEVVRGKRRSFPAGELEARLGVPLKTNRTTVADDTLDVLYYFGLEIGVSRFPTGVDLVFVALATPRYTAPEGLRIGYAEREVLRTLGRPPEMVSGTWTYTSEGAQLRVDFENRTVSRLAWGFDEGGR